MKAKDKIKATPREKLKPIQKSKRNWDPWILVGIFTLTVIIYSRVLNGNVLNWDDEDYILKNPYLLDLSFSRLGEMFTSFFKSNYHPLTLLSYWTEIRLFGNQTVSLHLINLLLHLGNAWLVYRMIVLLNGKREVALLVCAFFALHPMHVESVAWISERKDVLYLFFFLLSINTYIKYIDRGKLTLLILAVVWFVLSLLSKSAAVSLPLVLVALNWLRKRPWRKSWPELLPFVSLSVFFGILAVISQGQVIEDYTTPDFPIVDRLFIATYNLLQYLIRFFVPYSFSAFHPYPVNPGEALPLIFYISPFILALIFWGLLRIREWKREIVFGIMVFAAGSILTIQVLPVGKAMFAERYTYLPYIGLAMIPAFLSISGIRSGKQKMLLSPGGARILLILLMGVFAVVTWNRVPVWNTSLSLWKDVTQKYPEHFYSHYAYGNALLQSGDAARALTEFNRAEELNKGFHLLYSQRALARLSMQDTTGALQDMDVAVRLRPNDATLFSTRGNMYERAGDTLKALSDYNKGILLNPELAVAWYNRGSLLTNMGKLKDAQRDFNRALELDPLFADAWNNRGIVYFLMNEFQAAIRDYSEAIRLKPDYGLAYRNRGLAKLKTNDKNGACEDFTTAVNLGYKSAAQQIEKHCR